MLARWPIIPIEIWSHSSPDSVLTTPHCQAFFQAVLSRWLWHGLKESNGGVFVWGTPAALQIEMLMCWAVCPAIWLLMDRVYPLGWCSLHLLERQEATEWKSKATCTLSLAHVLLFLVRGRCLSSVQHILGLTRHFKLF